MDLQISRINALYASGEETVVSLLTKVLANVDSYADKAVFISRVAHNDVLKRAAELDALPPEKRGRLYGVPFAVKDNIEAAGLPTTKGLATPQPIAQRNAPVVQRALDEGAVLIGKTNLDQFATGLVGVRSPYGAPRCVFDDHMVSGGSSSGSGVAVGAHLVSFAFGTDTAGSGRVPAGFNNVVGVKPTKGILSATGVFPANRSQDCVSVFALSVTDGDLVRQISQGVDPEDPYSRSAHQVALPLGKLRIGIPNSSSIEFFGDKEAEREFDRACEALRTQGHDIVPFNFDPFAQTARLLYETAWVSERTHALQPWLNGAEDELHPTTLKIVGGGLQYSAVDAFDAIYKAAAAKQKLASVWDNFDVMLLPTTPTFFSVAELEEEPIKRNSQLGYYTNFVNLLDLAALAIPAGFRADKLPSGVTLVAPAFTDCDLARIGAEFHAYLSPVSGRDKIKIDTSQCIPQCPESFLDIVVVGAHLEGMSLNKGLTSRGAVFVSAEKTAREYRFYVLSDEKRPALVYEPGFDGPGIDCEIWRIPKVNIGDFLTTIDPPLGLGSVKLSTGVFRNGFIAEYQAIKGAKDITEFGGWRSFKSAEVVS
ncbi:allophanate hydrolase [Cognatishimia maritima]|uniref:Allophanate hydrolase n=1 Tax=Cognatishimia maritima TaxID=870908 RepID=A0A1M5QAP4_9RHOB|nr:allophanate hydrolase [Cognatishimia maritima]SHH11112.1 allophanate hydrolase [Cognatishimia maritima]